MSPPVAEKRDNVLYLLRHAKVERDKAEADFNMDRYRRIGETIDRLLDALLTAK